MVKFLANHGVREVRGNQGATKECYFNNIKHQGRLKETFSISVLETQLPEGDQKLKSGDETRLLVINKKTGQMVKVKA